MVYLHTTIVIEDGNEDHWLAIRTSKVQDTFIHKVLTPKINISGSKNENLKRMSFKSDKNHQNKLVLK